MKRILSLLLTFVMVIGILAITPISVEASAETDRVTNQIKSTYTKAKSLSGRTNFSNVCTTYVKYQLMALGITSSSDSDIKGNGNQVYNNIKEGTTSTGYTKKKYSGNNCLNNILSANSGNVYNIVVSWTYQYGYSNSNPGAGHVLFIHAIIDNTVYFSDNYTYSGKAEGSPLIMSLSTFMSKWNGMYGNAIGAVHFTKSHTHNYNTYVDYQTAHPHYKRYKCSCGDIKVDTSQPTVIDGCIPCISSVILGDRFYARIANETVGRYVTATSTNNVEMRSKNDSNSQWWLFELQSDDSYKITNLEYNKCIEVYNGLTAEGTNVQISSDKSSDAQRFYLKANGTGYSIVPKSNTRGTLDVAGGSHEDGTNVQQWSLKIGNKYQTFTIEYMDLIPSDTETYNGNTYEYYEMCMPWTQAQKFCENKGGHLITVSSKAENDFAFNMAKIYGQSYCWLGVTDMLNEGVWQWENSETINYSNWASSQPDNWDSEEHFVHMYLTGENASLWNDAPNNTTSFVKKTGFICEYETKEPERPLGDVDGDNDISIMDATLIQRHSAKQITLTDEQQKYADTDKDGKTSVMDATAIQRFIAKIITKF